MIFKKKDLEFLKLYALCVDPKRITGRNFQIKNIEDNIVRFSQVNDNAYLFTDIKLSDKVDDFCYNYPTTQIVQFLNTCREEDEIEFNNNSIKLSENAVYEFEEIDYSEDYSELFNEMKNANFSNSILDLQKINNIKSYIGIERGLDAVGIINNHFVSSDRCNATSAIKTNNKINDMFFLSKLTVNLLIAYKSESINYLNDESKYAFKIENTYIIIPNQSYIIPDIFKDEFKEFYDFKNKVIVDKESLLFALSRINVLAKDNIYSRIFLTFSNDEIIIESKDRGNKATEKIKAEIDTELNDHYVILSNNHLLKSVELIESKNVMIKILPDKEANVISVWPENNEDIFVIQNLLPYAD
jgi:hypothetical protein